MSWTLFFQLIVLIFVGSICAITIIKAMKDRL